MKMFSGIVVFLLMMGMITSCQCGCKKAADKAAAETAVVSEEVKKNVPTKKAVYIVACKKEIFTNGKTKDGKTLQQLAQAHAELCGGKVKSIFKIINGYAIITDEKGIKIIEKLPEVKYVEIDQVIGV